MNHNPYLIELLKKLVKVEYELRAGKKPTIQNIKYFIKENEGGDQAAEAIAEYIRKMWSKKKFQFNDFYLDRMVLLLKFIVEYKSWEDFIEHEGNHRYAKAANQLIDQDYSELKDFQKLTIEVLVEKRVSELFVETMKKWAKKNIEPGKLNDWYYTIMLDKRFVRYFHLLAFDMKAQKTPPFSLGTDDIFS